MVYTIRVALGGDDTSHTQVAQSTIITLDSVCASLQTLFVLAVGLLIAIVTTGIMTSCNVSSTTNELSVVIMFDSLEYLPMISFFERHRHNINIWPSPLPSSQCDIPGETSVVSLCVYSCISAAVPANRFCDTFDPTLRLSDWALHQSTIHYLKQTESQLHHCLFA
jgi:hypothetical protein